MTCLVGKIEMGQGAMTSLPQLVAEELDVALDAVDIVMGDTDLCPWDMGTFGSLSIRQFGPILRTAAAEAKSVLLQLAAERLQVPVAELKTDAGSVVHTEAPGTARRYGQLTEGKRIERRVEGKPALEAVSAFTVVGTSAPRRDAIDKVTGKAKFAGDVVPPGALHARVLRPPAHGATLLSVDTSAAEAVPGVKVVRDGDLVAVLHVHRDEADKALALVKAQFSPSPNTLDDTTIFDHLVKAAPAGDVVREGGTLAEGTRLATDVVEATYLNSYVAHAAMETHSAVASDRQWQGHRVGVDADAVPAQVADRADAQAPAREGPRHHAVCRRRVRRQERRRGKPSRPRGSRHSRVCPCVSCGAARRSSSTTPSGRRP